MITMGSGALHLPLQDAYERPALRGDTFQVKDRKRALSPWEPKTPGLATSYGVEWLSLRSSHLTIGHAHRLRCSPALRF